MKTQTVYIEVPVSERLPEESNYYITLPNNISMTFDRDEEHGDRWIDRNGYEGVVSHWFEKIENNIVTDKETLKNAVDDFLRLHPEYRCLDVIGKFEQYLTNLIK